MRCMGAASPWAGRGPLLVFEIGLSPYPLKPVRRLAHGLEWHLFRFWCVWLGWQSERVNSNVRHLDVGYYFVPYGPVMNEQVKYRPL